ncbi:hypothetical protein Pmar_PMAR016406 [Perkinsus marinus ATCC 50983]|uniref:Uncharacterized protein n=1 Tax=Perkinsus marinus (strain ATCC 50983 / TXsc) TaxID=423536 RepID=C5L168_PERM5|nr:hypothetical protein Pmar_PMAR016406 [Perkinsus marinus ATCC 50983]EER09475.1 hypothetical protein Pmar_PMAR016406 [Perkinsus marinus ATCC 50983]|eukprot:XP_002777659.1 hypothetical protein Pmar_PMAR016406 [Perkinsus marinus ATCC 50983]
MPMNPTEKERHLARAVCMGGDVKVLAGIDVGYEQALLRLMYGDEEPSALTTASKSSNPRKKRPAILPAEPMDKRQRLALPLSMMEGHNGEYLDKVPLAEDTVKRRLISRTAYRGGVSKEACNAIKAVAWTLISSLAGLILEDKKNLDAAKHRCSQSSMMQDDVSGSIGGSGSCTKVVTDTRPALSMLATLSAKDRSTSSSSSIQLREVSTESSLLDCSVDTDILMGQDDRITAAHVYYTLNLIQGRFSGPCTLRQLPLKIPRQFWPVWLARAHHKLIQLYIRQSSMTDIATQPPLPLSSSSSTSSSLGASGAAGGIG